MLCNDLRASESMEYMARYKLEYYYYYYHYYYCQKNSSKVTSEF